MAIDIKFDLMGNPEPPTIILANRNGNKLGQLSVNADSIDLSDKFNDTSELSFTLNKYVDDELTPLWDKVVDFKLVYCKEWDEWFEIKVELDEATETVKTVFCTQLGQAELSQIMLYNIEINTDVDIERDDYKISILYDSDDPEASILHRVLKDKAPHYSIAYVSPTIAKIQRNFSFDGTSIYDAFQEIAEEIGCLFLYYASINEDGVLERKIAVHDLQQTCNNESCGYRGEFTDKCPKCGSIDITNGYGEDTLIFVTSDELASEGIQLTTDTDSVKNCFKLEGGDDLMTATIRNCNPNGTDYIWYFSDSMKEDMSEELVQKIESYDEKYKEFYNERVSNLETQLLSNYNALVDKYSEYNEDLQKISSPITGYPALMNAYYNTIDLALYLESGLMPSVEISETNAAEQVGLLTSSALSPVAVNVEDVDNVSLATANSAVLSIAKVIVKSTYKVEIKTSTLSEDKVWSGQFVVTNYSDEEDAATSGTISITINNNTEEFLKQKIEKALNKENTEDLSISGLFNTENYSHNEFCDELKKYALNPLKSFYDACEVCLSILIDQGAGNQDEKPDLYESLYEPYYNKSVAIANEIQTRENEIAIIKGVYNKTDENNPILITKGLQQNIEECRNAIQAELNFETYLGETLWLEFCAYRREDKYSNDNYISDGLNNAEVFEKALEFIDVAENEIYKSSELQHSISTTLNNLLAIPKFKPLADSFKTGNWIRVQVDDKVHKLRLLEYDISFGDFNTIPVEFSDVTKIKNGTTDVQDVFAQASSMATSYSSVQRQASQGGRAKTTLEEWISDGLSSANVQIQSNDTEDITLTKHGLLARSYDDVTQTYSPEQLKLTHNIMAYTDDNWRTVRQAIGKHEYKYFDKEANKLVDKIGYGQNADFVNAGVVSGSQIIGGDIYSVNYPKTVNKETGVEIATGSYINLTDGTFSFAGGRLVYNGDDLTVDGKVTVATEGTIACWNVNKESIWKGSEVFGNADGMYFGTRGLSLGDKFKVEPDGTATMTEANVSGTITSSKIIGGDLLIGDETKVKDYAEIANDGTLTCTNVNIQGGTLAIGSEKDEEGNPIAHTWISEDGVLTTYDAHIQGTLTSPTIIGGTIEGTEIKGVDITAGSTLKVGQQYDEDGNVVEDSYLTWISDDGVLHAQGAVIEGDSTFSGTITASDIVGGTIKGTTIEGGSLLIGNKDEDDETSYYAWISEDGVLNANGANITGIINATDGGTIGGWDITEDGIEKKDNNDNSLVGMLSTSLSCRSDTTSPPRFYAGARTDLSDEYKDYWGDYANFLVLEDGTLYADNVHISGLITATDGNFAGQVQAKAGSSFGSFTVYEDSIVGNTTNENEQNIQLIDKSTTIKTPKLCTDIISTYDNAKSCISFSTDGTGNQTLEVTAEIYKSVTQEDPDVLTLVLAVSVSEVATRDIPFVANLKYHYEDSFEYNKTDIFDLTIPSGRTFALIRFKKKKEFTAFLAKRDFDYMGLDLVGEGITWSTTSRNTVDEVVIGNVQQNASSILQVNINGNLVPAKPSNGTAYNLGSDSDGGYWNTIYCRTSAIDLSDRQVKKNIERLSDLYEQIFDALEPVSYKFKVSNNNRTHAGFIAQDVKAAVENAGLTTQDFAAYCEWQKDDGTIGCGLRYSEFIALCVNEIQKLKKRVAELENK